MNRKNFGELITVLRTEHATHGQIWSQEKLGEISGLKRLVIGNIERGKKKQLEPETLLALSDALQLSAMERKELFIAAAGIDVYKIFHDDPNLYLAELIQTLDSIQVPSFIMDPYGDIVALNPLLLAFYQVDKNDLDKSNLKSKYNIMRVLFSDEFSAQRQLMGKSWEKFAHSAILSFRAVSLRYRAEKYFKATFADLITNYPLFDKFWKVSPLMQNEYKPLTDNNVVILEIGGNSYKTVTSSITSVTPKGELYMYSTISQNKVSSE
jgi:transcriptional regulator with XRE-family HTH domain